MHVLIFLSSSNAYSKSNLIDRCISQAAVFLTVGNAIYMNAHKQLLKTHVESLEL